MPRWDGSGPDGKVDTALLSPLPSSGLQVDHDDQRLEFVDYNLVAQWQIGQKLWCSREILWNFINNVIAQYHSHPVFRDHLLFNIGPVGVTLSVWSTGREPGSFIGHVPPPSQAQ